MSRPLAATIALYALGLAAMTGFTAARGQGTSRGLLAGAGVLEVALVLQGLIALGALAGGRRPHELLVWVGYLGLSVVVVPAGAWYSRAGAGRRSDVLVLAIASVAAAVIVRRLVMTWGLG